MKTEIKYGKKLTNKFIKRIFLWTSIYTFIFIILWLLCRSICSSVIWYEGDFFYDILRNIGYSFTTLLIIWLIGFSIIVIKCLYKTLSYVDSIVDASALLISDKEEDIVLPEDLLDVEKRMNQIKKQARKNLRLAQENEQRKNDLIVYLAHDIKTPLTSMIGYLSLLNEINDMPLKQRVKYINIALEKSYRLEDLINELFDISRFNAETIILSKEELNLTMMLEQIVDDFYPILKENNKEITIKSDDKIIIYADSDKIARVFGNIIKNAINYSINNDKIEIEVKKDNQNVIVKVKNKGAKIPEEKLKRIFEKFYRADSSRTSKTGGSGLGLAIAKEIVELHNGKIVAKKGGGICHLSNLLYYLFLMSPLTVVERHGHKIKSFPNPDKSSLEGIDATISSGWLDLKVKNETNNIYQIDISFDENYMYGKILSDKESTIDYKIVNGNLNYIKENNKIYECVEVIRIEIDKKTKKEIKKEKLYDEKVLIKYELPSDVKVEEM